MLTLLSRLLPGNPVQELERRKDLLQTDLHRPRHRRKRPRRDAAAELGEEETSNGAWLDWTDQDPGGIVGVVCRGRSAQLGGIHQLGHFARHLKPLWGHDG